MFVKCQMTMLMKASQTKIIWQSNALGEDKLPFFINEGYWNKSQPAVKWWELLSPDCHLAKENKWSL
jgi:hypothetical protein